MELQSPTLIGGLHLWGSVLSHLLEILSPLNFYLDLDILLGPPVPKILQQQFAILQADSDMHRWGPFTP